MISEEQRKLDAEERFRDLVQRWRRMDIARVKDSTSRCRRMGIKQLDFTFDDWLMVKESWQQRCAYCGQLLVFLTIDHLVPVKLGGPHTIRNIVPACGPCNRRKCNGPPPRFKGQVPDYVAVPPLTLWSDQ